MFFNLNFVKYSIRNVDWNTLKVISTNKLSHLGDCNSGRGKVLDLVQVHDKYWA